MTDEEYFQEMSKALAIRAADIIDRNTIAGMSLLSVRKKKKIRKWIFKVLRKKDKKELK